MVEEPTRVLIVDDSGVNRRNIAESLSLHSEIEVVGKAADGEEALQLALLLKPDIITLDLEMPRMDGFTFLRILMARQPAVVIVVSSYTQRENVFKALELGAFDFVTKPDNASSGDFPNLYQTIAEKILTLRQMRFGGVRAYAKRNASMPPGRVGEITSQGPIPFLEAKYLVAVASSTGGPNALLSIFAKLSESSVAALLVAQHMPDRFTRTFAERLDRCGPFRTAEAQDGDLIFARSAFVCPGHKCMEVVSRDAELRLRVVPPELRETYVPNADRLLRSVALVAKHRSIGLVLNGTGDNGVAGARAVRDAGGIVIAESAETAAVSGMRSSVQAAGIATHVMSLAEIATFFATLPE